MTPCAMTLCVMTQAATKNDRDFAVCGRAVADRTTLTPVIPHRTQTQRFAAAANGNDCIRPNEAPRSQMRGPRNRNSS
jgi:hypothetical protein